MGMCGTLVMGMCGTGNDDEFSGNTGTSIMVKVVGFYKNKTSFNIYNLSILTCMG